MSTGTGPYPASPYPASLTFDPPERIANWRPLVQWLLAIPHLVILYVLGIVSEVLSFVSWIVILITGKLPAGLADFQAMYLRYSTRVVFYAAFTRDEYPSFSFTTSSADPGDDARLRAHFDSALEGRNRLTVAFRLILVIPHIVVVLLLGIAATAVVIIAFFAVLFTGRWPQGLLNFAVGVARWNIRFEAYLLLLTDVYPPFSLD